jgi:hypothetical protein
MTLNAYDSARLDELSLRVLDLAALIRHMSHRSREYGIADFALHDKKALEWIANLERWGRKSAADLEMRVIDARASQRALARQDQPGLPPG